MRGEACAPALRVLADGRPVPGVMCADVVSNNHLAADRFSLRVAAGAGGLAMLVAPGVRLRVEAGLAGVWTGLVTGEADSVSLDPVHGVIDVEGRDLSALFIDSRVDETFANRTSTEIAGLLAGRHGLQVSGTTTSTLVGRYFQSEHDRLTMGQFAKAMSEWDLLAYLAGREGLGLFVEGETLRFGETADRSVHVLQPADCMSLQLERGLGMARTIEVTVRSWDQRGGQAVVQTVQGGGSGRVWRHGIVRPNLPAEEAQRLAERTLADLVRHEWTAWATMPGELSLTARRQVAIEGTGTDWDRLYGIDTIRRHIDAGRGFTQSLALQGNPTGVG